METLYATGIRHAEAHRLDLYDIDTAAQRLTVRLGKGQRDRLVPLTEMIGVGPLLRITRRQRRS